eukprot:NODE_6754_length_1642_cov_3.261386.p3 GENE.NODE_6754_length_1642_cov_3.261386~~NODE_6754_length_1642_cov_3.261386.p3  ORF type:complete len:276 (+),score=84.55 NODE_6754_length_1642_cov_3.261386:771-1598(+)
MGVAAFRRLLDMLGSELKVMTIAPSVEARTVPPFKRLQMLLECGVRPAFGHDMACTLPEVAAAMRVAAAHRVVPHVTHAFNVMRFHHRDCGLANVAMLPCLPRLPVFADLPSPPTLELVGESVHVSPLVLQATLACKGTGTACFATNGIAEPKLGHQVKYFDRVGVVKDVDGRLAVRAHDGEKVLVGSCAMMVECFRTAVEILSLGLCRAVDLCSCTPAAVAGLGHIGVLRPGKRADFILLSSSLDIEKVFVGGTLAHDRDSPAEMSNGTVPSKS